MDAPEPLDDAQKALLARERTAYPREGATTDAAWRRLELAAMARGIAIAPPPPAAPPAAPPAHAAKAGASLVSAKGLALAAAIAIGSGGLGYQAGARSRPEPPKTTEIAAPHAERTMPAPVATPREMAAVANSAVSVAVPAPLASAPALNPSGTPSSVASETQAAGASNLASERTQIDIARAALARGRPADALQSLGEHQRLYPLGKLREEREALAVQALAQSGQKAAAESRAERFRRSFPNSFFGPVVDQAVAEP